MPCENSTVLKFLRGESKSGVNAI